MSDWVRKLKSDDEAKAGGETLANAMRLHEAKIIAGKGPALWDLLQQRLEQDVTALKEEYTKDASRHCIFNKGVKSCSVQRQTFPYYTLNLTFNADGMCLNLLWKANVTKELISNPNRASAVPENETEHIDLKVGTDDGVYFFWKGNLVSPPFLSEELLRHLCEIRRS